MDRFDRKYVFHFEKLHQILSSAELYYKVLEIDGYRIFDYLTQYFDTPDYQLYLDHHNKKLNRFKVRKRSYLTTGITYIELKIKDNKGKTRKKRIEAGDDLSHLGKEERQFIKKHTTLHPKLLETKLLNDFSRITLVHKSMPERVTIDFGLGFSLDKSVVNLPFLTIAEIKKEKNSGFTDLELIFRDEGIHPLNISKYCIGTAMINKDIKYNRFKTKLLTLNKICNGTGITTNLF